MYFGELLKNPSINNVRWKFYAWKFTFHFDFFPTDLSTSEYEQNSWALGFVLFVFGHQRELGRVRSVFSRSAKSELWVSVDIGIKPLVSIASPISLLCLINSNSAGIDRKVGLFCQRHIQTSNFAVTKSKTELFSCYSLFSEHKQQDMDVHPDFKSLVFHFYLSWQITILCICFVFHIYLSYQITVDTYQYTLLHCAAVNRKLQNRRYLDLTIVVISRGFIFYIQWFDQNCILLYVEQTANIWTRWSSWFPDLQNLRFPALGRLLTQIQNQEMYSCWKFSHGLRKFIFLHKINPRIKGS